MDTSSSTHTTISNVQYVTHFYNIGEESPETMLERFKPILQQTSWNVQIFTDEGILDSVELPSSFQLVRVPRAEFQAFQLEETVALPPQRNQQKDTLPFIQRGLCKPECIKRAAAIRQADVYVWFDHDILRLAKHPEKMMARMGKVGESASLAPTMITIPGCIPKSAVDMDKIFTQPVWRFCSNYMIVPASCVEKLTNAMEIQFTVMKQGKQITWEFNAYAAIEFLQESLFNWYSANHNDTIVNAALPNKPKKVILLTMIKNESKIIKRLIESTLPLVDAICVCDTGSTDTTVEVLTDYFKSFTIPTKIYNGPEHLWKNFGHNRSQSFLAVVDFCKQLGWDADHTYALAMDADMTLVVQSAFQKNSLTSNGYRIMQKSPCLEYYNTRFLKIGYPWKCTGYTHEYWDGDETDQIGPESIYISDIGDGGCKADKFERDVRLLEEGLKESPGNPRYLFYLAQSYKDSQQVDKAIENYKKRIEAGGWYEEVWYSMYQLSKIYHSKKMYPEMEMWALKAYEYRKERIENILMMCRHFREKRQYFKAWHYYELGACVPKPGDLLFIETDAYEKGFEGERAILHDYVFPYKKNESIGISLDYYNKYNEYYAYTNLQWFVQAIPSKTRSFAFPDQGDFTATSTSFCRAPAGGYYVNVRYVNYRIQPNGSYLMFENGVLNGDNPVRTENYFCTMNDSFDMTSELVKMEMKDPVKHTSRIKGLEDVRIFMQDGVCRYIATTLEHSYDGKIRQHLGTYDLETHTFTNSQSLVPPVPTDCEKNWIPYKDTQFIYGWNPFRIGHLDASNKFVIDSAQATNNFCGNLRGSSNLVREDDFFYGIAHIVMYQQPRKYYHVVVKIDATTDKLVATSQPFYFAKNAIEYCLSFDKKGETCFAIVSQNDRDPILVEFQWSELVWRTV